MSNDKMAEKKTRLEIAKLEADIDRRQLELEVDKGIYAKRSDVEAALTTRLAAFDSALDGFFAGGAREIIALAGGDPLRAADLEALLKAKRDEAFNRLAKIGDYEVIFIPEEV